MREVKELTSLSEFEEALPIVKQLRTDLTKESYHALLKEMRKEGYTLIGLYDEGKLVAVAGVALKTNFYNKRHVFVFDLVTDERVRSQGYGKTLLHHIHLWGKEQGAAYVSLESAVHRHEAHRFYEENFDYDKWCYSFRVKL